MNDENILVKTLILYYTNLIQYTQNYLIDKILKNGLVKIKLHTQVLINEYKYNNPADKKEYNAEDTACVLKYFFEKKNIAVDYIFIDGDLLFNLL